MWAEVPGEHSSVGMVVPCRYYRFGGQCASDVSLSG
jgi:hypothetical protein